MVVLAVYYQMDIFQLIGDLMHLISILLLLVKILATKNVIGLSYRTQEMYLVVFISRYSDMLLENHWGSIYFNIMRFVFIGVTAATIRVMRFRRPYKLSYEAEADSLNHYYIYAASLLLGLIFHARFTVYGIFWSFSVWLEAFAILPQLLMISRTRNIENVTGHAVMFLGIYRVFYIVHWVFAWQHIVWTSFAAGVLQTALYADFIYYFCQSNQNVANVQLPI